MDDATRPKRPLGLRAFVLLMIGVALVGGVAGAGGSMLGDQRGPLALALTAALMAVAMGLALTACIWWWRGIDEAAREAHKWAWWWGGSSGMLVGAVVLLTLTMRDDGSAWADLGLSAADLVASGMYAILLFQMAGYVVAWAAWWLKHR